MSWELLNNMIMYKQQRIRNKERELAKIGWSIQIYGLTPTLNGGVFSLMFNISTHKHQKNNFNNKRTFKSLHLSQSLSLTKIIIRKYFSKFFSQPFDILIIFSPQHENFHHHVTKLSKIDCYHGMEMFLRFLIINTNHSTIKVYATYYIVIAQKKLNMALKNISYIRQSEH
jgi:hypothetical protein